MERAYNPQTGEYLFLVGNEWTKPAQTATNPKTGELAFLVGNQWEVVPGQKPAKETTPTPPTGEVMGADLGSAIMGAAAPRDPKTFTGSVFDTQPFEPPLDLAEAERLSRRAYAEKTTQLPRRMQEMRPTPEAQVRPRTFSEANFDTWAGVLQGGAGFVKSILDNIPGGVMPGSETLEAIDQGLERLKTPQLRSSQIAREGRIARARELEGEVGATRAAYQTMFTPAGADIVARGTGSILPSIGMSMANLGLKAITAANMLSNAGDAAVQSAEQLKQISPEQWSKDEVYRSLRDSGLSHRDAVAMLAPIYAVPAQAAGAATGYISGTTGLEKALTRGTERGVRAALGRAGAELGGEEVETLTPQFVGNLIAGTLNPKVGAMQGLGQAAVETAFAAAPGAGIAALPSKRINVLDSYAQSKGFADVQDMIRKVVLTAGQKAVEDELIDALDKEADTQDLADQQKAEGAPSVTGPVTPTDRAGVPVVGKPGQVVSPAGAGVAEPDGVVPAGSDVTGAAQGEGAKPAPVGFRYTLLESPAYEGLEPLSLEDADFELEALEANAEKGRMSPVRFAQSEIGKRLDTAQIMTINEGLRTDPVGTIKNLRSALSPATEAGQPVTLSSPRAYDLANSPQNTPLLPYITGINKQLDTFYSDLYSMPLAELPENLQKYRFALDDANAVLEFVQTRLAKWSHPAITGKNQGERAAAKAKATAEDRELLDMQSQLAGSIIRLANQAMAKYKGYKGKKAGSQQKIDAARDQLDKDGLRAVQLLYDRGLLTDEEAAEWEAQQEREAIQAEPAAERLPTREDIEGMVQRVAYFDERLAENDQRLANKEITKAVHKKLQKDILASRKVYQDLIDAAEVDKDIPFDVPTKDELPPAPSLEEQMRAKTDAELDEIIDTPWTPDDENQAARAERDRRKGVSEQRVEVDKPADITEAPVDVEPGEPITPAPVGDRPYYGSSEINAIGDKIKDYANRVGSDLMVGDMVRYGTTEGTVVGVDETHAKIHPDGAKNPKAYYRVPKASVQFIARPDTVSKTAAMAKPGEDKKFGVEDGNLNVDKAGLIQLLGASMYARNAADVAVKELLQNAFDAVKGAVSNVNGAGEKVKPLYKIGDITITFNDEERTITVTDNGRGMTPDIVRNAFFTIAGSDKSDLPMEQRSGGKGAAKMAFMFGSERLTLDTVRDGVRTRVDATAKEIADSTFKITKTPAGKGEHGTTVTVKIPEKYVDPDTNEERSIYFSDSISSYDVLERPLIGPANVTVVQKNTWRDDVTTLPIGANFDTDKYVQFKVNFGWGSADIYFGKERRDPRQSWDTKHRVLSAGVYQFDTSFKAGNDKIPYDIIVNVKPKVGAKHPDYPFTNNRESFTGRLKEDIASLNTYLAQISRGNEAQDLQDNFKNIVSMPRVELGQDVADTTNKLHKAFDQRGKTERRELPPMPKEVRVEGTRVISVDTGKVLSDTAKKEEKETKGTFQAEQAAPEMEDFLLKMSQNPKLPIFHNNTNVDFLEVGRQYGEPEKFFAELGTLMVEMKEVLADSGFYKYEQLKPENLFFGGVSVDKGYGGVHIKVPYKAVLINPFYDFGAKTLFGVREYLWETMTHEIAHTGDMGHGEGHNSHMLKVRQYLADQGLADYFRDALMDMLARHESTYTAMREAYGRSTTKNTAKSLKDYETGSASASDGSAASRDPNTVRPLPAGRGQAGDGTLRAAGPIDGTSGIPRAAGSTSPDSVKGLAQDVVDAINRNDISAALRAIARNTTGLYSELARRLAALNLPTTIVFNNERDLVKQVIDNKSAQQQIRLFAYLSRVAPEFYNKYFKDYDKAENLERVHEGLRKLNTSGIDTSPVNTELATVQKTYDRSMHGLTAGGFFDPAMDIINIRVDAKFGSNNRVLLHEVVHAATEYMLYGAMGNLTSEQQQAVADIYEMYDYAQSKLPPGDYGFTNLSEFIAEAMTNPKFQEKLKSVPYPRRKASVFNSLLNMIANLFGLGNLAGASMSAINDIFSPQRPVGMIKAAPLRFATQPKKKRVRGPISKPDTWRTAEKVEASIKDLMADATRGRVPIATALKELSQAMWDANGTAVRAIMLPILQLRQLKDLTRTKFPQITGAVDIVEKMVSYRGSKIKIAENTVQKWGELQGKYPKQSALMGRIMIEATIRARDPDKGVPAGGTPDALDKAWAALRPEFKSLYREVRNFYADAVKEMVRTMKERALGLPKAQRQAMIRKINEQFGPDKLVAPYFPLRRFGDKWFQIGKGEHKEFYTFSDAISRNLAFNKRRRELMAGNKQQQAAAETMRMGNGVSELYSQNIATTQVLRDIEESINSLTATDVAGVKAEIKDSLNQLIYLLLPQQSMRKMFINRRAIQGASGDMLRVFAHTAVHSAYQQSRFKYAEPFINNINNAREHIEDMEASHAVTPQQGAVYRDYVLELERRTKNILGVEDKSPIAQTVGSITGTTFFFMLSAPASAILNIVGMAQLTMPYIGARYGYAKANALMLKNMARYGMSLPRRSLAPLVQGNFTQVSFPSIVEGGKLSPLLQRAANRFVDDGDINISMTNDIFDLSERPSALYTGKTNTVKKVLAGVFHQAERLNREVGLLTTFELAYDKFLNAPRRDIRGVVERDPTTRQPKKYTQDEAFELAIQEARDIAGLTLGDYTRQMKGRVFTIPSINLISQFKQYAITATYNVLRNLYLSVGAPFRKAEIEQFRQQMIKDGLPQNVIDERLGEAEAFRKEVYREGMKRLAGILGMTFLFGGIAAQPFFSLLAPLIKMFAPDDDDEFFDWENWFYNFMETEVGGAAAGIFKKMGMEAGKSERAGVVLGEAIARGPVSTMTGTALSDRVSLDLKNLWWREGRYSPDARESLQQDVIANVGPSIGLALNWADAWQLASEGQWGRAFEKAAPAMFARPATAFRLGTEGATTRAGDVVGGLYPEEFSTWELAMQSIGMQPEKLAQAQKAAIQAKTYQQKILDRRTALLNRLWMERGTPSYPDALEKANEFSLKYPEVPIDSDAIDKSFNARAEAKAQAEAVGAKLNEKLIGRTAPMLRYGMQ